MQLPSEPHFVFSAHLQVPYLKHFEQSGKPLGYGDIRKLH